jgi:hypothetical protein
VGAENNEMTKQQTDERADAAAAADVGARRVALGDVRATFAAAGLPKGLAEFLFWEAAVGFDDVEDAVEVAEEWYLCGPDGTLAGSVLREAGESLRALADALERLSYGD